MRNYRSTAVEWESHRQWDYAGPGRGKMSSSGVSSDTPIINIAGELVGLGPMRRDFIKIYQRWANDLRTTRSTGAIPLPQTEESQMRQFDAMTTGYGGSLAVSFTIFRLHDLSPVGTCHLRDIAYRNRTAEFDILIGESTERGKGYGTEATRLTLDYAFNALGLNNVMLTVFEFNQAGRRAYRKAGFHVFGRRRAAQFMGGQMWDVIYMECLASEFDSLVLKDVFVPDQSRE